MKRPRHLSATPFPKESLMSPQFLAVPSPSVLIQLTGALCTLGSSAVILSGSLHQEACGRTQLFVLFGILVFYFVVLESAGWILGRYVPQGMTDRYALRIIGGVGIAALSMTLHLLGILGGLDSVTVGSMGFVIVAILPWWLRRWEGAWNPKKLGLWTGVLVLAFLAPAMWPTFREHGIDMQDRDVLRIAWILWTMCGVGVICWHRHSPENRWRDPTLIIAWIMLAATLVLAEILHCRQLLPGSMLLATGLIGAAIVPHLRYQQACILAGCVGIMGFIAPGTSSVDLVERLIALGIVLGTWGFVNKRHELKKQIVLLLLLAVSLLSLLPAQYRVDIITGILILTLGYAAWRNRTWEAPILITLMISLPISFAVSSSLQRLLELFSNRGAMHGAVAWQGIIVGLMIAGLVPFAYIVVRKKAIEDIVLKLGIAQGVIGWFLYTIQPQFRCILPFGLGCGFPIAPLIIGLTTLGIGITAALILKRRLPLAMAVPAIVLLPAPGFQTAHAIVSTISLVWLVLSIGILAVPTGVLVCCNAKRKPLETENDETARKDEVSWVASE